jgi:hypothetical protein
MFSADKLSAPDTAPTTPTSQQQEAFKNNPLAGILIQSTLTSISFLTNLM